MAFAGFAVTNPMAAMAMVDSARWRSVIYADTPRSLTVYRRFVSERQDGRRAVLFVLGAMNLPQISKDRDKFQSVFVFDSVQNLASVSEAIAGFKVVDIEVDDRGVTFPKHLSPADLTFLLETEGTTPETIPLLTKVTEALVKRRPSVLENTSRIPPPENVMESGAQRTLATIKSVVDSTESVPFSVVLDVYTKYLFRILDRTAVTTNVTKKLPPGVKEAWQQALDFASSGIGLAFARAFAALCAAKDPDYRVSHAIKDYGLAPYSGDFVYFVSVLPPFRGCSFLEEIRSEEPSLPLVNTFTPVPAETTAKKRGRKKA